MIFAEKDGSKYDILVMPIKTAKLAPSAEKRLLRKQEALF